jgi:hypothetical protein
MEGLVDFRRLAAADAQREPFEHLVAGELLRPDTVRQVVDEFPALPVSGLLPAGTLRLSPTLTRLADELRGAWMSRLLGEKFGIDLEDRPTMLTVRSQAAPRDGRIHTDSESKVVTLLLYLNPGWQDEGGRLRLLRSGVDLEDYAAEVSPEAGTLVAFRRSDHSWHGHRRFVGTRRYIMVNWMRDSAVAAFETARHRLAAGLKGVFA